MSVENRDMEELLAGASLNIEPDGQHMQAVHARAMGLAGSARPRRHVGRSVGIGAVLLVGAATAGLAGTQAGRNWVRQIVTPVYKTEVVTVSCPPDPAAPSGHAVTMSVSRTSTGGDAQPFTPEEKAAINAEMTEVRQISRAGGGRLTGLLESVASKRDGVYTVFMVEYTLAGGKKITLGSPKPERPLNGVNVDELLQLRDSGAGELISSKPFPIGLGLYIIRFTLSNGTSIDLQTYYPPGARAEREAIVAETRQLKAAGRFTVDDANSQPDGGVWGTLRYTLADGRQVGITEQVPSEALAPDGKSVITTESGQEQPAGQ